MTKKKKPQSDDPEQSARFIKLAKKVKAENDRELFDELVKKVVKPKPRKLA
jgi:hypothetical protein